VLQRSEAGIRHRTGVKAEPGRSIFGGEALRRCRQRRRQRVRFGHGRSVRPPRRSGKRPLRADARCATLRAMRILVSNADGEEAQGLRVLAEALLELGDVVVCAPVREQSATSRSISLHRPLRIEKLPPWGPDGEIERWSVDGTPTDAVYI